MADLLHTGASLLASVLNSHVSTAVTYHRGSESVAVHATIGQTEFEVDNGYGVVEKFESRDFLIIAADLVLGGGTGLQPVLPERGDTIRETVGIDEYVYEVMAPGTEPPWRYSDPYRNMLRIHTKHVDME